MLQQVRIISAVQVLVINPANRNDSDGLRESHKRGRFRVKHRRSYQDRSLVFRLDHTQYARWISVHLRDMVTLKDVHPTVFSEFIKGNFVVKKTIRRFSAIAIDHAHEQNNASVKDDGGAVCLTENPAALRRWMVSGPETARLIGEFEAATETRRTHNLRHHEESKHVQLAFARDVKSLANTIEEMINPFTENSSDLLDWIVETLLIQPLLHCA